MMLFGLFGQLLLHHLVASEGYLLKAFGLKHHNLLLRDWPHPSSYGTYGNSERATVRLEEFNPEG